MKETENLRSIFSTSTAIYYPSWHPLINDSKYLLVCITYVGICYIISMDVGM